MNNKIFLLRLASHHASLARKFQRLASFASSYYGYDDEYDEHDEYDTSSYNYEDVSWTKNEVIKLEDLYNDKIILIRKSLNQSDSKCVYKLAFDIALQYVYTALESFKMIFNRFDEIPQEIEDEVDTAISYAGDMYDRAIEYIEDANNNCGQYMSEFDNNLLNSIKNEFLKIGIKL